MATIWHFLWPIYQFVILYLLRLRFSIPFSFILLVILLYLFSVLFHRQWMYHISFSPLAAWRSKSWYILHRFVAQFPFRFPNIWSEDTSLKLYLDSCVPSPTRLTCLPAVGKGMPNPSETGCNKVGWYTSLPHPLRREANCGGRILWEVDLQSGQFGECKLYIRIDR